MIDPVADETSAVAAVDDTPSPHAADMPTAAAVDMADTPTAVAVDSAPADALTETPPDRLANNPASPFYDEAVLARGIGIRFKGVERNNVDEYCISENWVRVSVAGSRDRHGQPITIRQTGPVEAYFRS